MSSRDDDETRDDVADLTPEDEQAVADLLASLPATPMPPEVLARIEAALAAEPGSHPLRQSPPWPTRVIDAGPLADPWFPDRGLPRRGGGSHRAGCRVRQRRRILVGRQRRLHPGHG